MSSVSFEIHINVYLEKQKTKNEKRRKKTRYKK